MPTQSDVSNIYAFNGSLLDINAGGLLRLNLLNATGGGRNGSFISPNGQVSLADAPDTTFALDGGAAAPVTYLGSGDISLLSVLGLNIGREDVAVFSAGGQIFFYAPDGLPNLLGLPLGRLTFSLDIDPNAPFDLPDSAVVCFTRGTLIMTADGERAIESLRIGDRVLTRDNGFQRVRWIGQRRLSAAELAANPQLRPIRIAAGALGNQQPSRDLMLSPQHRLLIQGAATELLTCMPEALVAACHLLGLPGVSVVDGPDGVEYWHLMCDNHEVLWSNGAQTESLFAGAQALRSIDPAARAELLAIFPDMALWPEKVHPHLARPQLRAHEARAMVTLMTEAVMGSLSVPAAGQTRGRGASSGRDMTMH